MVSAEAGIAKEVLRKWETRYGFPVPVRDASGNRVYTADQVRRLKLIRKLLDDGLRPGQIVPLAEDELLALARSQHPVRAHEPEPGTVNQVILWLQSRDPALLRDNLRREMQSRGLGGFVGELMPAMNRRVGQAWESGDIAVRDEHLYSEIVQGLVRESLARIIDPVGQPRILLTTPAGEAHTLGILMLETVMSIEGAYCISLGAQSPLEEIASAAADFRADIVALSFSVAFPKKKIAPLLRDLRALLQGDVQLWAGGSGVLGIERTPRGVVLLSTLADAVNSLQKFRAQRPTGATRADEDDLKARQPE